MLDVDHERSRGTVSKNLKWRHEKPTVRCKLHAGTITQRSLILKMPWSKKKKKCKEWRGVHPGASAQISPKPQHLRAGGFQQTRKARLDHQPCGSVLRRAFRVCSWAACMYSWEWNFNYLDASITFLGPTGDQGPTPPHTHFHRELQEGRLIGCMFHCQVNWVCFSGAGNQKPSSRKYFEEGKKRNAWKLYQTWFPGWSGI